MKEEKVLNIYQRINEVMKKISYIQKDTTIGSGSYSYKAVTHDHVVNLVRPFLIKQGIVIIPNQQSGEILQHKGQDGAKQMLYSASYMISFVNSDKPEDAINISIEAHAQDSGDKAPGKTLTYAVKMAILKLFYLETGINDEERAPAQETIRTLDYKQVAEIRLLSQENPELIGKICRAYKAPALDKIDCKNYSQIMSRLAKTLDNKR